MKVLLSLERDPVLSDLWRTAPGKVSIVGGLTGRMAAYVAILLLTAFAALFPELGGRLLDWITPAEKALL